MMLALLSLVVQLPDTVVLPPVTVTATRQATSVFAVPLAVTLVKKHDLFGTTGYGLDDALSLVPGVVAQSRSGNHDVRLTIRGYGARGAGDRSNAGTSRGIRVLLDGFPETEPDGRTSFDGIDLAAAHSIEVVRSNASAVWGNAAGGVVSVSTLPEDGPPPLGVEPMAGSFGLRRYAARAGAGLGGEGTLGASVVHTTFDGWRAHSASRRTLLNLSVRVPASERTTVGVYAVGSRNLFRIPGPLTAAQVVADPRQANPTYRARDERRDNRVARLGVTFDHQASERIGISTLAYLNPKYLQRSERNTFRDFTRYHVGGNAIARIATPFGGRARGRLLIGADYALQDGATLFYSLTSLGTRGDTLRDNKGEGARSAGVFVTEELSLGSEGRWTLALGGRYDAVTYDYRDYIDPSLNARRSFTGLTPKVGLTYRLGPSHSVYASLGGGIEVPAGNETDPVPPGDTVTAINPLLEPVRSTTLELGTKRALRHASYEIAFYHTAVANEIVPYRGGRFYFTAGRVRRRGAEIGLRIAPAAGLAVQAAVSLSDHRYTRYVVDSVHYGTPGAVADYSGNHVVGVPSFTDAVTLELAPRMLKPLRVRFGVQGMSAFYADDANQVRVPAYRIATLTVGIDGPLQAFVTIHNLFNRRYIASAFLNPDVIGGEPVAFEPAMPRHVVAGFSLSRR